RTNAAFLISAYAMLYLGRTPEEAYAPFENYYPPFPPFHDASPCICTYNLTILDCLRGIHRAKSVGFFDFDKFNIDEYEYFERVENGDLNWLAEGKVLAFAGPHEVRSSTPEGYHTLSPDDYIPYFKKKNVSLVVRLNKKYYDENRFKKVGIDHVDLYYLDGSCPTDAILNRFLSAVEKTKGAFAVHCKAGLGRTGTCIGAWMMKHYNFSAAEVIGWLRVCRPGSVIGPQQHYLKEIEPRMWAAGERARRKQAAERVQREVKQGTLHTKGSHHSNM
ncbi:CDC14A, partial [Symbiodinium sp. KB8]